MRVACLKVQNYRGIKHAEILFPKHAVLIGDNNTGKTTLAFNCVSNLNHALLYLSA